MKGIKDEYKLLILWLVFMFLTFLFALLYFSELKINEMLELRLQVSQEGFRKCLDLLKWCRQ